MLFMDSISLALVDDVHDCPLLRSNCVEVFGQVFASSTGSSVWDLYGRQFLSQIWTWLGALVRTSVQIPVRSTEKESLHGRGSGLWCGRL